MAELGGGIDKLELDLLGGGARHLLDARQAQGHDALLGPGNAALE